MNKGFKRTKYGNLKTYNISDEEFEKNPNNTIIIKIKDKNKNKMTISLVILFILFQN